MILHDGLKHGIPIREFTVKDHPLLAANFIKELAGTSEELKIAEEVGSLISTHMGQWRTIKKGHLLPALETTLQRFVHQCDYLSSRKLYDKFYMATLVPKIYHKLVSKFNLSGQELADFVEVYTEVTRELVKE